MAGALQDDDEEITGINVTPLVDVMLVLLVIFMVTATYIVNQSINIQLPSAATGDAANTNNLAFVLDRDSRLFLNGKPIELSSIAEQIALERKESGSREIQALIAADRDTPHGAVVKLIDVIRKNGIRDFAINVESE